MCSQYEHTFSGCGGLLGGGRAWSAPETTLFFLSDMVVKVDECSEIKFLLSLNLINSNMNTLLVYMQINFC